MKSQCIVALATLSKFFVITIRPRLKVIKFQALQGSADTLPLISWQMVVIQSADSSRVTDPVLAVARGTNIFFHQVRQKPKITSSISLILLNFSHFYHKNHIFDDKSHLYKKKSHWNLIVIIHLLPDVNSNG